MQNYNNVVVYASNGQARNNIGQWNVEKVDVEENIKGFDFYAAKDLAMAQTADYGFMIWNGKSKGTFNNIVNLVGYNKKVLLYFIPDKKFYTINAMSDISGFIDKCDDEIKRIYLETINCSQQVALNI